MGAIGIQAFDEIGQNLAAAGHLRLLGVRDVQHLDMKPDTQVEDLTLHRQSLGPSTYLTGQMPPGVACGCARKSDIGAGRHQEPGEHHDQAKTGDEAGLHCPSQHGPLSDQDPCRRASATARRTHHDCR